MVPRKGAHILHIKWLYKTITDTNGDTERYKSLLVVLRNEQVLRVDYTLTFAAVWILGTVKLIPVLSRWWNLPARHGAGPNEYIKAGKKEHPDIHMKVYNEMNLDDKEFKILGAKI